MNKQKHSINITESMNEISMRKAIIDKVSMPKNYSEIISEMTEEIDINMDNVSNFYITKSHMLIR